VAIITCRTVSIEQHRTLCPDFPLFTLAALEPDQRATVIKVFPAEHGERYDAHRLMHHLARTPQLLPLAANPLLLNILCYVVDDVDDVFPTTRRELYTRALVKLLTHASQRVDVRYPGEEPTVTEKPVILERMALNLFAAGDRRLTVTEEELGHQLKRALRDARYGEAPAPWANALRVDLVTNSGILRGTPAQGFFFLHLTIQEFLVAAALVKIVNAKEWDVRWQLHRRDGKPLVPLSGPSLGAAFALGLAKLSASQP